MVVSVRQGKAELKALSRWWQNQSIAHDGKGDSMRRVALKSQIARQIKVGQPVIGFHKNRDTKLFSS